MIRGLSGMAIAAGCFFALIIIAIAVIFLRLPDVQELKGCLTTALYHVHLCESDPSYTPLGQISPYIIGAIIMSEDASFYAHQGVDVDEMKESIKKDVNELRFARGGSTIT